MAISLNTPTMLSLDRFAQIVGLHPLLFNQVVLPTMDFQPSSDGGTNPCGLLVQNAWQAQDSISREDIALAINGAENDIASLLGYKMLPQYEAEEVIATRPYRPELWNRNYDIRGYPTGQRVKWGYLVSGGVKAKTIIAVGAGVVYASTGIATGYANQATVTVNVGTLTDPNEIRVFLPNNSQDDAYEVRPIKVSINTNTGVATITMRREQLVKTNLLESLDQPDPSIDGTVNSNFETTVDVVRVFTDPSQQATFTWRHRCNNSWCTGDSLETNCQACTLIEQAGCISIVNPKLGMLSATPAVYDAQTGIFTRQELTEHKGPDRLTVYYMAGFQNKHYSDSLIKMDRIWEDAVARLALSRLDRELTSCNNIQEVVRYWSEDLAMTVSSSGRSVSAKLTSFMLNCPWGTSRGALYAYRRVFESRIGV